MFASRKGEEGTAPLVLSDTKPSVFLGVMEFIYTNSCSLSVDMVTIVDELHRYSCPLHTTILSSQAVDMVAAAIEYGLDGLTRVSLQLDQTCSAKCFTLVQICVRFMRDTIAYDSVCKFLQV